tara:strand:- start:1784 stop:2092 length:309 start_codon:yes stop_codon:yes gene_type:complete
LYEKVQGEARFPPPLGCFELTLVPADLYINEFAKEPILSPTDLESKLDELTQLCEALLAKQQQLSSDNQRLTQERAQLLERNVTVKSKVEGMILRLKSLEQD